MKTRLLKSIFCFAFVFCLLLGMTACGGGEDPVSGNDISNASSTSVSDVEQPGVDSEISGSDVDPDNSDMSDVPNTSDTTTTKSGTTTTKKADGTTTTKKTDSAATPTKKPTGGTMLESLRGTEVEYYTWADTRQSGKSEEDIKKVIGEFEKSTGITVVETKISYSDFDVQFAARMVAGNIPDVIYLNGIILPRMQYLQPVSNLNYDFSDSSVWDQETMKNYTVKGKSYAINLNPSKTLTYRPTVMCYNKSEISKYDLDDPYTLWKSGKWTWKEMLSLAKDYYKQTGNPGFSVSSFWMYAGMTGIQGPFSFDGKKVVSNFESDKFKDTLSDTLDWKKSGILSSTLSDASGFDRGKLLLYPYNASVIREGNALFENMKKKNSFGVVPLPEIDGQSVQYMLGEQSAYGIPKGAPNAAAVPYFLSYYLDKSHYDQNNYFYSKEALEVYNAAMSGVKLRDTRFIAGQYQTNSVMEYVENELFGAEKAQLNSLIQQYGTNNVKPTIQTMTDLLNRF